MQLAQHGKALWYPGSHIYATIAHNILFIYTILFLFVYTKKLSFYQIKVDKKIITMHIS